MPLKIKIRISLWFILFCLVSFLLYKGLVPFGHIAYSYDFYKENNFISKLSPSSRVDSEISGSQKIYGDPVYFSLHTPRKFEKALIGFYFKSDKLDNPIIESGVMVDGTLWRYDLKPLENKIIDDECKKWGMISYNNLLLCQKDRDFSSIDDFLSSTTTAENMALYNYKLDKDFFLMDYVPNDKEMVIDTPLKGSFQFYTYIKDEKMDFEFLLEDINNNKDKDPIDVNIYYNDVLIDTRHMDDDGNDRDDNNISEARSLLLEIGDLPEAVYKIELRVNDDIITKRIITKQQKMAFANKLNLAKTDDKNVLLYSDSNRLEAITVYPDRLQTIKADSSDLRIEETYKQFTLKLEDFSSPYEIKFEKDGVIISGNGVFSFTKESLINPSYKRVDSNLDIEKSGIKYILADYALPVEKDGWKYKEIEVDLSKAYRENRSYSFIISVPGLRADDGIDDFFEIDRITVELDGKNIVELFKEKLHL